MAEVLRDNAWTRQLRQTLPVDVMRKFVVIWTMMDVVVLNDEANSVSWKWTSDCQYTAKSAYSIQFEGCLRFNFEGIDMEIRCSPALQDLLLAGAPGSLSHS